MKKTVKLINLLILAILILTGCSKVQYDITVNRDGSADVQVQVNYKIDALEAQKIDINDGILIIKSEGTELKNNGFTVEYNINNTETIGYTATKHYDNANGINIADATTSDYLKKEQVDALEVKQGIFINKYYLNTLIDLSSISITDDESKELFGKELKDAFDIKITINTPGIITKSNATTINGNTAEWNINIGQTNQIEFQAISINLVAIIVVSLILICIIVGILIFAKKKKIPNQ